jgi:Outer membrane protein beta-barrel domain
MTTRIALATFALACLFALPQAASAQAIGFGPRFSFVRGDIPTATPSTRFMGATLRMRSSRHMVLEIALDYRSEFNEDHTIRRRETPLQGSLLIFPVRAVWSPYLLGGMGIYSQVTDTLGGLGGGIEATTVERKTGWHIGLGAELYVSRRAAFFADYRFRFVQLGATPDAGAEPINLPGLSSLKLTHHGSMWTSGMAFYF